MKLMALMAPDNALLHVLLIGNPLKDLDPIKLFDVKLNDLAPCALISLQTTALSMRKTLLGETDIINFPMLQGINALQRRP